MRGEGRNMNLNLHFAAAPRCEAGPLCCRPVRRRRAPSASAPVWPDRAQRTLAPMCSGWLQKPMSLSLPTAKCSLPDPHGLAPRCVPNPAVRNRTGNGNANVAVSSKSGARRLADPTLPSEDRPSLRESRSNLSQAHQPAGRQASKKKSSGVLGFLRLKEPSTSALEDFADHERRRATQKGGKPVMAAASGTSSQRLPDYVPKVNSKWNGLPEPPKAKNRKRGDRGRKETLEGLRDSVSSYGSITNPPDRKTRSAVQTASGVPDLPSLDPSSCFLTSPEASPRTPAFEEGAFPLSKCSTKLSATVATHEAAITPEHRSRSWASGSDDVPLATSRFHSSISTNAILREDRHK